MLPSLPVPAFTRLPSTGSACIGQRADVGVAAGLIAWLESPAPGQQRSWAADHHARMTIPFGLGVSAALGALGEPDPFQDRWTVREARIRWHACAADEDALEARAVVTAAGPRDARVDVEVTGSTSGRLVHAEVRVVPMLAGRYAHAPSHAGEARRAPPDPDTPPRPSPLGNPPSPDAVVVECSAAALDWLVTPLPGFADPPGRRVHPLGGAPLGAAISAWSALRDPGTGPRTPCDAPPAMEAVWLAPLPLGRPFTASATKARSAYPIEVLAANGTVVLRAAVV